MFWCVVRLSTEVLSGGFFNQRLKTMTPIEKKKKKKKPSPSMGK